MTGFVALEWLVAIALSFLLLGLTANSVTTFVRFGFHTLRVAESEQQASLAGAIVKAELRRGAVGDWAVHPGDSVQLRAFRGWAWICGTQSSPSPRIIVVFQGDRRPNPAKDSVLVHGAEGAALAFPLRSRQSKGVVCPSVPAAQAEVWDLGGFAQSEGVLRLFEKGAYSLRQGALRYRVGRGGRQPVAGSTFDTSSTLRPTPSGRLGFSSVELLLVGAALGSFQTRAPYTRHVAHPRRSLP